METNYVTLNFNITHNSKKTFPVKTKKYLMLLILPLLVLLQVEGSGQFLSLNLQAFFWKSTVDIKKFKQIIILKKKLPCQ